MISVLGLLTCFMLVPSLAFTARPSSHVPSLPSPLPLSSQSQSQSHPSESVLRYSFSEGDYLDRADAAEPLSLSTKDLERLSELKTRAMTMPIVIMDVILPGQKLHFQSADPKFEEMIKYVLASHDCNEIGIIGFNPHSKHPLNFGVTAPVVKKNITYGITRNSERILATSFKGQRSFQVVGEPWMDDTHSFYLANVEIVDNRHEIMPLDLEHQATKIHNSIPKLVQEWIQWVIKSDQITPAGISDILKEIGPMPTTPKERAIWVGALVNPTLPLGLCAEIRPAMLACRNDHDRLLLASAALQSSIDQAS